MSDPDYILPPPPALDAPDGVKLRTAIPADADARPVMIQTLENWTDIYQEAVTRLLQELWEEGRYKEDILCAAAGMSRMGVRKRANPEYREKVNKQRRERRSQESDRQRQGRKSPPPESGDST